MHKLSLFFLLTTLGWAATPPNANETNIRVDSLTSTTLEDPTIRYGLSPAGLMDVKKTDAELNLPTFGQPQDGLIRVTIIGAINRPGHYFIKAGASIADLITEAGGQPRLSTSRFILRREDVLFLINIGNVHTVAPVAKIMLPLFLLKNTDRLWISDPSE